MSHLSSSTRKGTRDTTPPRATLARNSERESKSEDEGRVRMRVRVRMMPLRASIAHGYVLRGSVGEPFFRKKK